MSIGLNANLDGTGSVQIGGSDAIQLSTGLAATFVNNVSVAGTASVTGNLSFNSGYGSAAVAYGCRAWVNFNGTGTVAIRASGNVTSITDNGVGNYTINFTNALPDVNYETNVTASDINTSSYYSGASAARISTVGALAVGSVVIYTGYLGTSSSLQDQAYINVSVFR